MADYKEFLMQQATRALASYIWWNNKTIENIKSGEPLSRTPLTAVEYYQEMMIIITTMQANNFDIDYQKMYQDAKKLSKELYKGE